MSETTQESKPHVVIVEPDTLQLRLLARILKPVSSFTYAFYDSLEDAARHLDTIGQADLVVLPIHGESGFLAAVRDDGQEPRGVQFARAFRTIFPQVPIIFYTGGAGKPEMCNTHPRITFHLLRTFVGGEFEAAVLNALKVVRGEMEPEPNLSSKP